MAKSSRTASNYWNDRPEHVERLPFIRGARDIGFSIGEIKELLTLAEPGRASCAEV
jgi:DNA-binding transcriptional MerR regulator